MIKCQQYIFQLTSGQLDEAGPLGQLQAFQHRLICRHCRAFTRNNRQVDDILRHYREDITSAKPGDDQDKA
jgi:hypothetical protein